MNLFLNIRLYVLLLVLSLFSCRTMPGDQDSAAANAAPAAATEQTVVYVVRHAEKDISDPKNQDADLTEEGRSRSEALREKLEGEPLAALFATKFIRTKNTLKPLSVSRDIAVQQYEAHDFNGLKTKIMQQYAGKNVVVAGHSNTVLPIIESFGVRRPIPDLAETQYSYLFKITIASDGATKLETMRYGADS